MNLDQELRSVLGDRAESGEAPVPDFDALRAGGLVRRRRRRVGVAMLQAVTLVGVFMAGLFVDHALPSGHRAEPPGPISRPTASFEGRWTSTDVDASHQTMTIRPLGPGVYAMLLRDDMTGPCSGPSTDSGTGRLASTETSRGLLVDELVVTGITTVCRDHTEPTNAGDSLTFVFHPRADTLTDNVGVLWTRP